jgi:hypothetical protein
MKKHADRQFRDQVGGWLLNLDRFYAKQQPDPAGSGCILWTGVKNNIGYPFTGVRDIATDKYKMVTGHRIALTIKLGRAIHPGMNANHFVCNRKDCVNPDHLSEGTQSEKILQMKLAGIKNGRPPGEAGGYQHKQLNRKYKYSDEEIAWVRDATVLEISHRYQLHITRAAAMRKSFRDGYVWLPWPGNK